MEKPLVSVVLPIYNVKKYLDRCVQSVINQSYYNLEIIMVDDGSTDGCSDLCDQWKDKDRRIRVIHKENAGLGMARNTGIENAHGDYICFLDSDDYIRLDTFEKAVTSLIANNSEIVIWGWGGVNQNGKLYTTCVPQVDKESFNGDEIINYFLPNLISEDSNTGTGSHMNLHMSAWASMYSMELINKNNWRFVSEREIIAEDVYSLLNLYSDVQRVSVIQDYLYFYCINESSLTKVYRPDRYWKVKKFYIEAVELCKRKGYGKNVVERVCGPYLSFSIAALKQESIRKAFGNENIAAIITDDVFQNVIGCHQEKHNLKKRIFYWAARKKLIRLCELFLKLQT